MYSLFVSHLLEKWIDQTLEIFTDRFLEATSPLISAQLRSLSTDAIECIKAWPCVLMQEGRGEEEAHITQITAVKKTHTIIQLVIKALPSEPTILNAALWKVRTELDIGQFEFSRNHWAIKDRDLFKVLGAAGHSFPDAVVARFDNRTLPAPARSELINLRKVIGEWGHTDIDDFLLEAGVDGLVAGKDVGSRRDRANAIVEFALQHPDATTAEDSLFSAFIVRRAVPATIRSESADECFDRTEPASEGPPGRSKQEASNSSSNRVFIVHGQNDEVRASVASFLVSVGLVGIVLHDQPNMGRHLLTKFIDEADLVTFAIILMTDDDVGGLKGTDVAPRARQNVILELGYFLSHLGQEKVCALVTPGLETPSDFDGIVYIPMDESESWKVALERELKAAKMPLIESPRTPEEM